MQHTPSRRRVMMSSLVILALIGQTSATVSGTEPEPPGVLASSVETFASETDAIRFRETFGFASSLAFVRAAAADPSRYSNLDYGVPLDAAEAADLARRAEIQAAIDPVVEKVSTNETFAGMYLDQHAGGAPVFMFTAGLADRADELSTMVPAEYGVRTQLADRTYKQLTEVNDRIASTWDRLKAEGIDIVRAGIRTDLNVVEVGVHDLTPADSKRLEDDFGPGIVVGEEDAAQADALCVDINNCRPMKGGLTITRPGDRRCTSGFVVKALNTGGTRLLTAGHCIAVNGGYGAVWSHNGDSFGTAKDETWNVGATRDGDVGLIDLYSSEVPTTKNQLHTTGSTVKGVAGWDSAQYVGDQSCRVGSTSGLYCGEITAVNVTKDSTVTGVGTMTVRHTNEVSFDSKAGDSGGAMYFYLGLYVIAQGTHVHSDPDGSPGANGWFTPIYWGRQTLSGLFGYDYLVCTNPSCS